MVTKICQISAAKTKCLWQNCCILKPHCLAPNPNRRLLVWSGNNMQQFRYTITAVLPRHSFGFYILTFLTIWQGLKNQQRHHNQSHYLYRANRYGTFAVSASIPILHPSLLTRFLLHVTKFNQIVNAFCIIDIFTTYSTLFTNLNILSLTLEALFCARQTLSPFFIINAWSFITST